MSLFAPDNNDWYYLHKMWYNNPDHDHYYYHRYPYIPYYPYRPYYPYYPGGRSYYDSQVSDINQSIINSGFMNDVNQSAIVNQLRTPRRKNKGKIK